MNINKIAVIGGHCEKPNTGAVGVIPEEKIIKETVAELVPLLRQKFTVHQYVPNPNGIVIPGATHQQLIAESLNKRARWANALEVDFVVEIHANATPGGTGTEVFYSKDNSLAFAKNICDEICTLGYRNRGAKQYNWAVIRQCECPAVLVETCFCDNTNDVARYNPKTMAYKIYVGICKTAGVSPVVVAPTPAPAINYVIESSKFVSSIYSGIGRIDSEPTRIIYYLNGAAANYSAKVQAFLNAMHMCDEDGHALKVDGQFGANSKHAFAELLSYFPSAIYNYDATFFIKNLYKISIPVTDKAKIVAYINKAIAEYTSKVQSFLNLINMHDDAGKDLLVDGQFGTKSKEALAHLFSNLK
jgi:hypothetical protein